LTDKKENPEERDERLFRVLDFISAICRIFAYELELAAYEFNAFNCDTTVEKD
jgi:hypothetical protein